MAQLSDQALAEMVEFYEAAAYLEMYRAGPASLNAAVEESDDCVSFFVPSVDALVLNRSLGIGLRTKPSRDLIGSITERYKASGIKNYGFQVSPAAANSDLLDSLRSCDLHRRDNWVKVYRDNSPETSSSTDLRIERVTPEQSDIFGKVAQTGFGQPESLAPLMSSTVGAPGWIHYLAWDGDTPAGVSAIRIQDDIGWLGIGAVLPQFRRRGGQGALMSQRINDGRDLGCKWFITETGEDTPERPNPSFHNMIRTGFQVAYLRPSYMPPKQG
jgi:hypothetical protein